MKDKARRLRRISALGAALILGAGLAATAQLGDNELRLEVSTDGQAATVPPLEAETTTTTAATTTTTSAAVTTTTGAAVTTAPVRPARPVPKASVTTITTAPRPPAPQGDGGVLVPVTDSGLWAFDTVEGVLRRVGDVATFDVAGDTILYARGNEVFAAPMSGGSPQRRYALPDRIGYVLASPDGHVLAMVGNQTWLVDPTGRVVNNDMWADKAAWNRDGTLLAAQLGQNLRIYRPDGTLASGPTPIPRSPLMRLAWSPDNRYLIAEGDAHRFDRYELATGVWDQLPHVWRHADYGPDGRVAGQRLPGPGWTGFTHPGMVIWDPATGAVTNLRATGFEAVWAPSGTQLWTFDPLRPTGQPSALAVIGTDGRARFTLDSGPGSRIYVGQPQWSGDGRYLVFSATTGPAY